MTDRQNCMELCGDVVDAYRDDGLRLERALAMLHKLTTPGHTEPYLGDSELVARSVWVYMAQATGDEPEAAPRHCPICDAVLERRPRESFAEFARRETDSKSCAGQLRSRKNRAAKEAVTA